MKLITCHTTKAFLPHQRVTTEGKVMGSGGISFKENHRLSIKVDEFISIIPTFRTKKEAISAGSKFGWSSAFCIERRFEKVWAVGTKDFHNDCVGKVTFEVFRLPLLKWEKVDGITRCPVLSIRRYQAA
ncbi:hypothetical protein [Klebsiella oxytoca]|uniref:hypothetical protein n=1 Tax=Klebsiella oxytoca TaxID=571 RepID=UPI001D0F475B|nr:hypothetical protein [Klebsiella oxytoca]